MRNSFRHATLQLLFVAVALLVLACQPAYAIKSPGWDKWKKEGVVFSNTGYNNPDFIKLANGSVRAFFMASGKVLSATSSDGKRFTLDSGMRVDGEFPALVKLSDGRLRMYFSSREGEQGRVVKSAVSSDGMNFTVEEGIRLSHGAPGSPDSTAVIHMHVIELAGGGYRMYFDADSGGDSGGAPSWNGIMSASSKDGLTWAKDPGFRARPGQSPIGFTSLVWSPFAQRSGSGYRLYFSAETDLDEAKAKAGIYLATSKDGLKFKVPAKPYLGLDPSYINKKPRTGQGGMLGLPQDLFIIPAKGGKKRLYYWLSQKGTYSAISRR